MTNSDAPSDHLRRRLGDLLRAHGESEARLIRRGGPLGPRITGSRPVHIALDDHAIAVRTALCRLLAEWSRRVVRERGVPSPTRTDVIGLVVFLGDHLDWLAEHQTAASFEQGVDEIARLTDELQEAPQSHPLGACPVPGCTSGLRVTIRAGGPPGSGPVRCDAGHPLPPHRWLALAARLELTPGPPGVVGRPAQREAERP